MKVHELIAKLQLLPQNHEVVVSEHSQYALVNEVTTIEAYDNGGYISHPFRQVEQLRAHDYVYIGS